MYVWMKYQVKKQVYIQKIEAIFRPSFRIIKQKSKIVIFIQHSYKSTCSTIGTFYVLRTVPFKESTFTIHGIPTTTTNTNIHNSNLFYQLCAFKICLIIEHHQFTQGCCNIFFCIIMFMQKILVLKIQKHQMRNKRYMKISLEQKRWILEV